MPMTARGVHAFPASVHARRALDWTFLLLALLPAFMALATRSAPAVVTAAAGLATVATVVGPDRGHFAANAALMAKGPLGGLAAAFVGLAAVSLAWSAHTRLTLLTLGEALLSAAAVFTLIVTLGRATLPRWFLLVAVAAFAIAAIGVVAELSTGLAIRRGLGIDHPPHAFNRTVMTLLVLYWPIMIMCVGRGLKRVALILGIFLVIAVLRAHSGATMLGLATAIAVYGLTRVARRAALVLMTTILALAFMLAPYKGELAERLLPTRLVELLAPAHARDRIEIWQSFGEAIRRRPIVGTGFGTSVALADDSVATEVPEGRRRVLLGVGHAHDQAVQIWTELGLVGALLAAAIAALVMHRLWRLPSAPLAPRLACLSAVTAIAVVGHGIWQGWWIAVLGVAILLFRLAGDVAEEAADGRP